MALKDKKHGKFEWVEDCIHLKACRRVQKIGKSLRLNCPRYCTEECTAYERAVYMGECVTVDDAVRYAREGAYDIKSGRDSYDVYCSHDLWPKSFNAVQIIAGPNNDQNED